MALQAIVVLRRAAPLAEAAADHVQGQHAPARRQVLGQALEILRTARQPVAERHRRRVLRTGNEGVQFEPVDLKVAAAGGHGRNLAHLASRHAAARG
jgi:hypothetical protein